MQCEQLSGPCALHSCQPELPAEMEEAEDGHGTPVLQGHQEGGCSEATVSGKDALQENYSGRILLTGMISREHCQLYSCDAYLCRNKYLSNNTTEFAKKCQKKLTKRLN